MSVAPVNGFQHLVCQADCLLERKPIRKLLEQLEHVTLDVFKDQVKLRERTEDQVQRKLPSRRNSVGQARTVTRAGDAGHKCACTHFLPSSERLDQVDNVFVLQCLEHFELSDCRSSNCLVLCHIHACEVRRRWAPKLCSTVRDCW